MKKKPTQGKTLSIQYVDREDQSSYHGHPLVYTEVQMTAYDKNCGSPSLLEIRMEEGWFTPTGKFLTRNILHTIPREEVLKLKAILNTLNF